MENGETHVSIYCTIHLHLDTSPDTLRNNYMPYAIFSKLIIPALFLLLSFGFIAISPPGAKASCNGGGCCEVVRVPLPGGKGVKKEVQDSCNGGYKASPKYGTTDFCECVPSSTQICSKQGGSCTSDTECQSDPGCGSFVCLGFISGRTPGKCEDSSKICSKANLTCSTDADCQSGGSGCSQYTCWTLGSKNKACRLGVQPSATTPACGDVDTAIGKIPTCDLNAFARWFVGWAVGIGGGIAFLLMLMAGFRIMSSGGNPDQIKAGKEQLTAAITGLLFIVFSVFLLQLIGVDILHLPGFAK